MIFESAVLTVALWCLPDKRTPGNLPTLLGWSPQYMKGCPMTSAFTYRPTVTNRLTDKVRQEFLRILMFADDTGVFRR